MSKVYRNPTGERFREYVNVVQRHHPVSGIWINTPFSVELWFKKKIELGELVQETIKQPSIPDSPSEDTVKVDASYFHKSASDFLTTQQDILTERGKLRDSEDGERSMAKTVEAFNLIYGKDLTEQQGWEFMVLLKTIRSTQGSYHEDDFQDRLGYAALAAEAASKEVTYG